jgi:hypothetical protein
MGQVSEHSRIRPGERQKRPRLASRWWFWLIIVVAALLLAVVASVGSLAISAKSQLEEALPLAAKVKASLVAQDTSGAAEVVDAMAEHTGRARADTSSFMWRAAEFTPILGANFTAVRELSTIVDDLVVKGAVPLATVASGISTDSLKPVDGVIAVQPLVSAQPVLAQASALFAASADQVNKIDRSILMKPVSAAVGTLRDLLATNGPTLQSANELMRVIPGALGADGPRDYLLVFQNNTEVMPRGGTIGNLVQVHVENGHIELSQQASPLDFPLLARPVIPIAVDALAVWPNGLGRNMQSLTMTPRFSLSFEVAKEMWKQRFGTEIDGLIALDPIALSYIISATGPITLQDGSQLTGDNLVQSMLSDVYVKYTDPEEADAFFQAISATTFGQIISGGADPAKLLAALVKSGEEKRLLMWTDDPAEQDLISRSPFFGEPPVSSPKTDGFGVYFRDQTPSKMAFYLQQAVEVGQAECSGQRFVRINVKLTNGLPQTSVAALPEYVSVHRAFEKGSISVGVSAYAPAGYSLFRIRSDGGILENFSGTDGDYAVGQARVALAPAQAQTVTMDFVTGDTMAKKISTDITPVVNPTSVGTAALDCAVLG